MDSLQQVTAKLRVVKNELSNYFNQILPTYGVTPIMMYTIQFLRRTPEAIAVDIANEFGLTRGAVTQLLDKLEQEELVKRKPHPVSRRSLQIHVTDKGLELSDAVLKEYNAKIGQLFQGYTEEELNSLRQLLDKLPL
ncbi:MarR family transcriptional regulator [Paenibacillus sp. N1-5-1-14]|uniref:MarR family winged helix-turn-helix transcriptional regulator n=1 Tax=Paenibacillus radicibacter TaxID=2972488 RepID=UPI002158AE55|nr:MarR family transcriptional regulator [Paenibacillus radicibacter]MCR8641025.1 MarR family transcriptional regulator [Paenibacillus radicibacter]